MTPFSHVTVATCNAFQDRSTVLFWNKLHLSVKLFFFLLLCIFTCRAWFSPQECAVCCMYSKMRSVGSAQKPFWPCNYYQILVCLFSVPNNSLVMSNLRCFCIQIILPLILQNSSVMWKAKKSNLMGCTWSIQQKRFHSCPVWNVPVST